MFATHLYCDGARVGRRSCSALRTVLCVALLCSLACVLMAGCSGLDLLDPSPPPDSPPPATDAAVTSSAMQLTDSLRQVSAELRSVKEQLDHAKQPAPGAPPPPESVTKAVDSVGRVLDRAQPVLEKAVTVGETVTANLQAVSDAGGVANMTHEQRAAAITSTGAAVSAAFPPIAPYVAAGTTVLTILSSLWAGVERSRKQKAKATAVRTQNAAKSLAQALESTKATSEGQAFFGSTAIKAELRRMSDDAHAIVDDVQGKKAVLPAE